MSLASFANVVLMARHVVLESGHFIASCIWMIKSSRIVLITDRQRTEVHMLACPVCSPYLANAKVEPLKCLEYSQWKAMLDTIVQILLCDVFNNMLACPVRSPYLADFWRGILTEGQCQGRAIKMPGAQPVKCHVGHNCAIFSQSKQGVHCKDTATVRKNQLQRSTF